MNFRLEFINHFNKLRRRQQIQNILYIRCTRVDLIPGFAAVNYQAVKRIAKDKMVKLK